MEPLFVEPFSPAYYGDRLFNCLHAGTIPIYWGAHDIQEIVPPGAFIDRRALISETGLRQFLHRDAYRRFAPETFVQLILDLLAG
jgi:hypothetical protein